MSDWYTVVLSAAQLAIIGGFLAARVSRPRRGTGLFSPVCALLACQAITYGIRPMFLCWDIRRFGALFNEFDFHPHASQFAATTGLLATCALLAGYSVQIRPTRLASRFRDSAPSWAPLAVVALAIGLAGIALRSRLARAGVGLSLSPDFLLELVKGRARAAVVGQETVGYGHETLALLMLPPVATASIARLLSAEPRRDGWALFVALAALLALAPVGSRELMLQVIVGAAFVWHVRIRRFSDRSVVGMGLVLVVFAAAVAVLRSGVDEISMAEAAALPLASFDGFEALVSIADRFALADVFWGRTYFESLVYTYVPRALWSGKPVIYGGLLAQDYVYPNLTFWRQGVGTFPVGFVTESLLNFWYAGPLVVPFLMGMAARWIELAAIQPSRSVLFVVACGLFMGFTMSWVRAIGETTVGFLVSIPLAAVVLAPRVRARRARPSMESDAVASGSEAGGLAGAA